MALEWGSEQLMGMTASVGAASAGAGAVRIRSCFQLQQPPELEKADPAQIGAWLKDELAKQGVRGEKVVVTLPRSDVVVKRLEVPDAPDDELPILVRFQAAAKSSQPIDELMLDFLPAPRREGLPREVLVATYPKQSAEQIRAVCAAAGLQLASLGITPVALAELVARNEVSQTEPHTSIVVSRHGQRLEIFVLRRELLLFSHGTRLPEDYTAHEQQQATLAEVSRALVALKGLNATVKVECGWLLVSPGDHTSLLTSLKSRLGCEVNLLDPLTSVTLESRVSRPTDPSLYAGPVGILLSQSGDRVASIDFLAPRQPPVKKDPRKKQAILAGIGVGVAALLGISWYTYEYLRLNAQLELQIAEDRELNEFIKKGESVVAAAGKLDKWNKRSVGWLDEFAELGQHLPPRDRLFITGLKFEEANQPNPKPGDPIGKVVAVGLARERKDVETLTDTLIKEKDRFPLGAPITPAPTSETSSSHDKYYPWHFESEIVIRPPRPPAVAAVGGKPVTKGAAGPSSTDKAKPEVKPVTGKTSAKPSEPEKKPATAQPVATSATTPAKGGRP